MNDNIEDHIDKSLTSNDIIDALKSIKHEYVHFLGIISKEKMIGCTDFNVGDICMYNDSIYMYACTSPKGPMWVLIKNAMDPKKEERVIKFINDFKCKDKEVIEDLFMNGYCFWFAKILSEVFNGILYYNQEIGHFICDIDGDFFDIRGKLDNNECITYEDWGSFQMTEPSYSKVVYRDSILKLGSLKEPEIDRNFCDGVELKIYG